MWKKRARISKKNHPKRRKMYNFFLGSFIVIALIAYIIQMNDLSTKGYKIKQIEQSIEESKKIQQSLEGKSFDLQTLNAISSKIKNLDMIQSQDAIYLYPHTKTVLQK